jgi:hypothetical protein
MERLLRFGFWIYASDRSRYQASNVRCALYPEDKPSHYDVFYGSLPGWMGLKEIGGRNPSGRAGQHQKSIPANGLADHGMASSRDKELAHVTRIDCLYERLLFFGHRCLLSNPKSHSVRRLIMNKAATKSRFELDDASGVG